MRHGAKQKLGYEQLARSQSKRERGISQLNFNADRLFESLVRILKVYCLQLFGAGSKSRMLYTAQLAKLLRAVGISVVCLAVVSPLNVLYHQVRHNIGNKTDAESELISEFASFTPAIRDDHVALVEPLDAVEVERNRRLFLAQFALAPVLVTRSDQTIKLVDTKISFKPAFRTILMYSKHYILVEE